MQYYSFELDNEIQNLSTIITLLGKYKHLRPLMGLKCSPDIFQSIKESVLSNIEDEDVYVNGVGAFLKDWKHKHLAKMLYWLNAKGLAINPSKCELAVKETDWQGYWVIPHGLKPWKKNIDAILHMDYLQNATELCMFIGCVTYYLDMAKSGPYS